MFGLWIIITFTQGGAFDQVMEGKTPFMFGGGEGINAGVGEVDWVINKDRYKYDSIFDTLNPIDGKVSGASAKSMSPVDDVRSSHICTFTGEMIKSKLPNNVLGKVWKLSDVDKDGLLDSDEFALAMHLINIKLDGEKKTKK